MDTSEAAQGLGDIEAFLYRESHLHAAYQRVAAFTAREPGLSLEQKRDIERWYVEEQRHVARLVTEHIADSISTAQEQHHLRLARWLRGTLTANALIVLALVVASVVVVGSLS